ncbi:MAG: efflux RND transporter periplasmic adaptor subunit [Candidatus Faecousia sp.]|nr:efflux RND transporter periplasmic adaptor subunit [Bacillota bacterium]MDY4599226.1 efflux RND transporter periplasmic adaptor subunit [Candidatus Faecousia sp.]
MKRKLAAALVCALCLTLSACGGSGTAVYVQSVERLAAMGGIAPGNRFLGLVVSEHTAEVTRDADKTIQELLVKEGDDVKEGQPLFRYDTEELQLNLDKKNLELEQLKSSIESCKEKIKSLERERSGLSGTAKLQYTVEIQSAQVDQKEAELKLKTKEDEVKKAQELLDNSTVTSPITGRVQKINENDTTASDGKPAAYITIQQSGAYRVKGVLGELQRGSLKEGDRVKMVPRTEENAAWTGTVTLVDYENPTQGSDTDRYSGMSSDEMTSASRYPFYVELDSTDGLMLGQHLYIELDTGTDAPGVGISGTFLCYNEDGSAYVWAEKGGKLEKRAVTLGDYDPMTDVQKITEGLSLEDYIAYPDPELCRSGAPTTHDQPVVETEPVMEPAVEEGGGM